MIKELRGQINLAIEQAKEELPGKIVQAAAKTLAARFDELAPRATERMNELMEQGENLTVSLKASQDILNRAEISPKVVLHAETKTESTERRIIIDTAMLRQLHILAVPDEQLNVTPETPELPERFRGMVASDEE